MECFCCHQISPNCRSCMECSTLICDDCFHNQILATHKCPYCNTYERTEAFDSIIMYALSFQFDCVVKTKRSLLLSDCCTFQTIRRHQSDDLCIIKTFHIFSQKVVLFRFYGFFCSIPTFEWIESHEIDPKELENTIETEIHITMNRGFFFFLSPNE